MHNYNFILYNNYVHVVILHIHYSYMFNKQLYRATYMQTRRLYCFVSLHAVGIYMGAEVTHFCMEVKNLTSTLSQVMDEQTQETENDHEYGHCLFS